MNPLTHPLNRRDALKLAAGVCLGGGLAPLGAAEPATGGVVEGLPEASKAGAAILVAGGNAVDAAVAAALVAGVVAPHLCGPGGYGGHMVVGSPDGQVTGIDFNSTAPAAATPDMFPMGENGRVKGEINFYGWKAAGVPGTLAGLDVALTRIGTRKLADVAEPAIRAARDGFPVSTYLANSVRGNRARLARDPELAKLLLPGGEPPKAGDVLKNPDLAAMFEALAERGSVQSLYRGDIAARIAAAFRANGGLVTETDLAAYRAREVEPLAFTWNGLTVRTPPPTAGGATVLEALAVLKALGWDRWAADDPRLGRARLEGLRLCWDDRLKFFGDPDKADVPLARLLDTAHATELAAKVTQALRDGKPAPAQSDGRTAGGTVHLSAVDSRGMMVAVTLTHGGSFGAQVAVPGLGLILGHGMSRFDPRPSHPNAPGPGKRPLHNMCPTVVLKDGRPVLALGGRGGRRIPNAVFEVLARHVGRGAAPADAIAAPRLHTDGSLRVELEPSCPEADAAPLKEIGYTVARAPSAVVSAVWRDGSGYRGISR
jgi:gamma-glutamyltranspeptidase / glutathione hydrolase